MAKHTTSRSKLVNGCGTLLKKDRLTGGYKLVKRKRTAKTTTTASAPAMATKGKVGRKLGSKNKPKTTTVLAPAMTMATKGKVGRKLGSKNKPKTTTVLAPVMKSPRTKIKTKRIGNDFIQAKERARKSGAKSFSYEGKTYVQSKALNTGLVVYKRSGNATTKKTSKNMPTAPAMPITKAKAVKMGLKKKRVVNMAN